MQRVFIIIGFICLMVAILWPLLTKLGLGKLPGDIVIDKGGRKIYFPITTSIILSVIITILIKYFR